MRPERSWHQANVVFHDPHDAERLAVTRIFPTLLELQLARLIHCWWFLRKRPWKLRYLATDGTAADTAFKALAKPGPWSWTTSVYEPEAYAFGGPAGMDVAHALFHADSRHILERAHDPANRRELSVLLFTAMMRAAGLDRFEQGDVWARVLDRRPPAELPSDPVRWTSFKESVHCLLTTDTRALRSNGSLTCAATWFTAFEQAGTSLAELNDSGFLTRGLRAVIAHHTLFAWNRLGLPSHMQASIAQAAKEVIFEEDP